MEEEQRVDTAAAHVDTEVGEQPSPEVEARAREMGWRPKEEFPGDPDRFIPAAEYVERADNLLPIARSLNKRLEAKLRDTQAQVQTLLDSHKMIQKQSYEKAMRDILSSQAEAIKRGDGDAYVQLEAMKDQVNAQAAPSVQQAPAGPPQEFMAWKGKPENSWYGADPEMTEDADVFGLGLQRRNPTMPLDEIYERTSEHMKRAYPHKFAPKRAPQAVEGGGRPSNAGGKGYSSLPADAKAACDRFVKQGLMTREAYVKDFFGEN